MKFLHDPELRCNLASTLHDVLRSTQAVCVIPFDEIESFFPIGFEKKFMMESHLFQPQFTKAGGLKLYSPNSTSEECVVFDDDDVWIPRANPNEVDFMKFTRLHNGMSKILYFSELPYNIYVGGRKLRLVPKGSKIKRNESDAFIWTLYNLLKERIVRNDSFFYDDDMCIPEMYDYISDLHAIRFSDMSYFKPSFEKVEARQTLDNLYEQTVNEYIRGATPLWRTLDSWLSTPAFDRCIVRVNITDYSFRIEIGLDVRIAAYYFMKDGRCVDRFPAIAKLLEKF